MKIAFFELEGWEGPALRKNLPGHELLLYEEVLAPSRFSELADCDAVSPFVYSKIDAALLSAAPRLRLVATRSTGFDHIDLKACEERGITVCNVPEYGSQTVAEHCFAMILVLSRKIVQAYSCMRAGSAGHRSAQELRGFDLRGKTLGLIGAGNIGLHVIKMARSFGMKVLVFDPVPRGTLADLLDFEYVPLDRVLSESDILSLHCPATRETRKIINRESLAKMKRGAILINTARGELVDTAALLEALQSGHLSGAGLDVFEGEALVREEAQLLSSVYDRDQLEAAIHAHKLLKRDDVIVTPHNAFNSREAVERILHTTIANIAAFVEGKARNTIRR